MTACAGVRSPFPPPLPSAAAAVYSSADMRSLLMNAVPVKGPPKLEASKGKEWLKQAKAAEELEAASALTTIQETAFDEEEEDDFNAIGTPEERSAAAKLRQRKQKSKDRQQQNRGNVPPPPPPRRSQPKRSVANTLKAARHKVAKRVGVAKKPVSLEGKGGTSIKDSHLALQAYHAYIQKEKSHKRSEGYATMKMNQKYTLRNRAALAQPMGGPGSMNTWALAQNATSSTIKFSKKEALAEVEVERLEEELMSLPEFTPYFTYTLSLGHTVVMFVMLVLSLMSVGQGDFGKIGVSEKEIVCSVENRAECPFGFDGKANFNATRIEAVNPWIGPSQDFLIKFNARLTTCMRTDTAIQAGLALQREQECGTINSCDTGDPDDGFSCCRHIATDNLGMMSKASCREARGVWEQGTSAGGSRLNSLKCSEVEGRIALRPCCQGHKSQCSLTTKTECAFADGFWHNSSELCSEVACLKDVCGSWSEVTQNVAALNEIEEPNQGWRFVWSVEKSHPWQPLET